MKKWVITLMVIALLVVAALTVNSWLPVVLQFLNVNSETIQSLSSFVQLILWVIAGVALISQLWRRKSQTREVTGLGSKPTSYFEAKRDSVALSGDVTNSKVIAGRNNIVAEQIKIGDKVEGNKTINMYPPPPTSYRAGSAPPLPSLIIGRENDLQDLKDRLCVADRYNTFGAVQVLTAVRGWPGVGKTTLAAALAHDPEMVNAFPDGVLWVSLGQKPSILSELATLGRALGTDEPMRPRTVEEATAQLTALLRDKRMLLIVDDAWEAHHVMPFKVGGHRCGMLVTTRIKSVAENISSTASNIYNLGVLTDEKGLELLKLLAPSVVDQYPEQSLLLIRELEGLPLALQVAGRLLHAEVSSGFNVEDLLGELREGKKILQAKAPADRADLQTETIPTVAVLLKKSTDFLDLETREYFASLAPFAPKPATFDLDALKSVWQIEDPKPTVRTLVDRGLLEPVATGRFQMHALLVMHAVSLCTP